MLAMQGIRKLEDSEMVALDTLTIIVSFMHMFSTTILISPVSRRPGLLFTTRSSELEAKLNVLKPKADFSDYVAPVNYLLEPGMACGALAALDDFILHETEAELGQLHQDIVKDSLQDLEKVYAETKSRLEEDEKKTTYIPLREESSPPNNPRAEKVASQGAKEKTRPAGSSVYKISPSSDTLPLIVTEPVQQFNVKATTASLFTTLFSKSKARGSVSWTDFALAMADLQFSVTPKGGSAFTFNPPTSMNSRPINLHRPHSSEIEGEILLIYASRLHKAYGWTADSFVVT